MLAKVRQVIAPVSSLGNYPEARAFRATVEFIRASRWPLWDQAVRRPEGAV